MAVPVSGMTPARRERNGNKHKRLFMGGPGGLTVQPRTAMLCLAHYQTPCEVLVSVKLLPAAAVTTLSATPVNVLAMLLVSFLPKHPVQRVFLCHVRHGSCKEKMQHPPAQTQAKCFTADMASITDESQLYAPRSVT